MPMSEYMRRLRAKLGKELLEVPAVSILTFDEEERVLLIKHADIGLWTTPGGAVDPLESPSDAAVREMWEETGLHVELVRVLGVYGGPQFTTVYSNGDTVAFLMTVFEARILAGSPRPDMIETLEVRYFNRAELAQVEHQPWVAKVLSDIESDRGQRTHFEPPSWRPPLSEL